MDDFFHEPTVKPTLGKPKEDIVTKAPKAEYTILKPALRSEYEYQKHRYKKVMKLKWDWTFDQYCAAWYTTGPLVYKYKGRKALEYCIFPRNLAKPFGKDNYVIDTNRKRKAFFDKTRRKKNYTSIGIITPNGKFRTLAEFEKYYNITRYKAYSLLKDEAVTEFYYTKEEVLKTEITGAKVDITDYKSFVDTGNVYKITPCHYCGKTARKEILACKAWQVCKYKGNY